MTPLAEKLKWPVGTRVVFRGEFGPIEFRIAEVNRVEPEILSGADCENGKFSEWLYLADLELAPTYETSVRWEVRTSDDALLVVVPNDGSSRWWRFGSRDEAREFAAAGKRTDLKLVRITTRRRVKR